MDTYSEKTTDSERNASIRLHYSRQFQSGGQAHTIDAEVSFPVGTGQEAREQVIHELEIGVEQLARQIVQRNTRSGENSRPQTSAPSTRTAPDIADSSVAQTAIRPGEMARRQTEVGPPPQRQTSIPIPATRTPVSDSMPTAPTTRGESDLRLADFIQAIKRRWNMSPKEAMDLLNVKALDKLNFREAYRQLQVNMEQKNPEQPGTRTSALPLRSNPIIEAPRQLGRETSQPLARPPTNQAIIRTQNPPGPRTTRPVPGPSDISIATEAVAGGPENEKRRLPEMGVDFAGSPKGPIPIKLGVVKEISPAPAYKFEEEDDEDELDFEDFAAVESKPQENFSAQLKLEELREIRGNTAASAERLAVLQNVLGSQISEEQLQQVLQAAWGTNNKKRLKTGQVEALISWAKEDFFEDEVEATLALIENEEG
jgi:hypothetical protein